MCNNRRSLIDEQLNFDDLYDLYYKYVLDSPTIDWIIGACYIRVSTNEQDKFSPLSQLKEILEYSLQNHIYIPSEYIYQDIGKSGMKDIEKRVNFLKLMEVAKKQSFKILLLYKFSRFARTKEDSVYYKAKLRKEYKIEVVSIKEALPNDNSRVLVESLYEGQDEYYVLNFRDESQRGKKEKVTRGEWLYAPPFGYIFDRNIQTLIIDNNKAKIVRLIYKKFNNNPNISGLTKYLNESNVPSPRNIVWTTTTVKRILRNPAYIGYIRFCDGGFKRNYDDEKIILFKGLHKPIIDESLFKDVQEKMKYIEMKHRKYAKQQAHNAHWLSSILKCGSCGKSLTRTHTSSRKPYFQCSYYHRGSCSISHHIKEETVVPLVLEQIKHDFTEKLNINITKYVEDYGSQVKLLEKNIEQLNNRLKRVKIAYEEGIDGLEEYKEKKNDILKKISKISKEIELINDKNDKDKDRETIYMKCNNAYEILIDENAPLQLKQKIANDLFDKIVYDKQNEKLIIYYKI